MVFENINLKTNLRETARLEAFSDAVFAISITLLVLEIKVPTNDIHQTLLEQLQEQWPVYLSYVVSFLVIGIIWSNHHDLFNAIRRVDQGLILLNLIFLMVVAFIPFPTALLGDYAQDPSAKHLVAIIYSATLMLGGLIFVCLRFYAYSKNRLIDQDTSRHIANRLILRSLVAPVFYLLAMLISLFSVELSIAFYLIITMFYALPATMFHTKRSKQEKSLAPE